MLEYPEVVTLAEQLAQTLPGKRVQQVFPPVKPHKFCWFSGDPASYDGALAGSAFTGAEGFGLYVELAFDNGCRLCFNDGVSPRLLPPGQQAANYQLLIAFTDGWSLVFTVAMYGGLLLHNGELSNAYYLKSRQALSPTDAAFPSRYWAALTASRPSLSLKAFLATEQRFPGIGNGVLQDILWDAGLHPKRKLATLSHGDKEGLLKSIQQVLTAMAEAGGRDTERDLFGQKGGYATRLSKNALACGCPRCGGALVKETYLGGTVYYCPQCQHETPPDA